MQQAKLEKDGETSPYILDAEEIQQTPDLFFFAKILPPEATISTITRRRVLRRRKSTKSTGPTDAV
jgi:hypothetical protein